MEIFNKNEQRLYTFKLGAKYIYNNKEYASGTELLISLDNVYMALPSGPYTDIYTKYGVITVAMQFNVFVELARK